MYLTHIYIYIYEYNVTGNQIYADSNKHVYGKLLRKGVRCLELDCWDGPVGEDGLNKEPVITHGHAGCTQISFR